MQNLSHVDFFRAPSGRIPQLESIGSTSRLQNKVPIMQFTTKRTAFTLIEILVVVLIVGVLIGMLLPAVQKVREAAAYAECKVNLQQIGVAIHAYQEVYNYLPATQNPHNLQWETWAMLWHAAEWVRINGTPPANEYYSYLCSLHTPMRERTMFWYLQPFMEGADELDPVVPMSGLGLGGSSVTVDTENCSGRKVPVKNFQCPSRRPSPALKNDYGFAGSIDLNQYDWWQGTHTSRPWIPVLHNGSPYWDVAKPNMLYPTLTHILDGASNTILLAHKGLDPEFYTSEPRTPAGSLFGNNPKPLSDCGGFAPDSIPVTGPYCSACGQFCGVDMVFGIPQRHLTDDGKCARCLGNRFFQRPSTSVNLAQDNERFPFSFFRDKKKGYYNGYFGTLGYPSKAPCFEYMTSPHVSMPILWADGSVRSMAFTQDPTFDVDLFGFSILSGHFAEFPSPEVKLLSFLWNKNDGNGVSDAYIDDGVVEDPGLDPVLGIYGV